MAKLTPDAGGCYTFSDFPGCARFLHPRYLSSHRCRAPVNLAKNGARWPTEETLFAHPFESLQQLPSKTGLLPKSSTKSPLVSLVFSSASGVTALCGCVGVLWVAKLGEKLSMLLIPDESLTATVAML